MAEAMNEHWDQAYQIGYDTAVRQMYLAMIDKLWELSPAALSGNWNRGEAMTDMQRWEPGVYDSEPPMTQSDNGSYVLAVDAQTAIAEARKDMVDKCIDRMTDTDLDNLVSDDAKDIIFKAFRALLEKQ